MRRCRRPSPPSGLFTSEELAKLKLRLVLVKVLVLELQLVLGLRRRLGQYKGTDEQADAAADAEDDEEADKQADAAADTEDDEQADAAADAEDDEQADEQADAAADAEDDEEADEQADAAADAEDDEQADEQADAAADARRDHQQAHWKLASTADEGAGGRTDYRSLGPGEGVLREVRERVGAQAALSAVAALRVRGGGQGQRRQAHAESPARELRGR